MPIDTRTKRQNAAQVGCPLPVSILPSGTIGVQARYQSSWSYRPEAAPPPAGAGGAPDKTIIGWPWPFSDSASANVGV